MTPKQSNPSGLWPKRYRKPWPWIIVAIVTVALLAVGTPIVWRRLSECDADVLRVAVADPPLDECVGVTGSYAFEPRFQRVVAALAKENEFATKDGENTYVTVAFMGPLTSPDGRVVHQLEGAVAGQHRSNREDLVGDRPRIRLVLANTDSLQSHWKEVTDRLVEMVDGPEHLVAVASLGLSTVETVQAARRLSEARLPMVADVVTADEIDKTKIAGFARVNPTVGNELEAISLYMRTAKQRSAMMVTYSEETDLYTASLAAAFKKYLGGYWKQGGSINNPFGRNPSIEFKMIVGNLCSPTPPDTIFYGGRGRDLPTFIGYLSNRNCHPERITIVTGSDAAGILTDSAGGKQVAKALSSSDKPISLIYAPLAEPSVLRDRNRNPLAGQYERFEQTFKSLGFDPAHLRTGWGIMSHDAVLTCAHAIRLAAMSQPLPEPEKVRDYLYLLSSSANNVPGASGQIEILPDTGNRRVLQMPVLRLNPGGDPEVLDVYPLSKGR